MATEGVIVFLAPLEALVLVFEGDVWRRRVDYESVSRTIYKEEEKRNERGERC